MTIPVTTQLLRTHLYLPHTLTTWAAFVQLSEALLTASLLLLPRSLWLLLEASQVSSLPSGTSSLISSAAAADHVAVRARGGQRGINASTDTAKPNALLRVVLMPLSTTVPITYCNCLESAVDALVNFYSMRELSTYAPVWEADGCNNNQGTVLRLACSSSAPCSTPPGKYQDLVIRGI
ncbi:hypothetical protein RhiJN_09162 [Ceratobasidium sp. AG-Ba]|nr:hypothetical protein RhiJN_09162 [Ceratobasidium sp. AG-Ba]